MGLYSKNRISSIIEHTYSTPEDSNELIDVTENKVESNSNLGTSIAEYNIQAIFDEQMMFESLVELDMQSIANKELLSESELLISEKAQTEAKTKAISSNLDKVLKGFADSVDRAKERNLNKIDSLKKPTKIDGNFENVVIRKFNLASMQEFLKASQTEYQKAVSALLKLAKDGSEKEAKSIVRDYNGTIHSLLKKIKSESWEVKSKADASKLQNLAQLNSFKAAVNAVSSSNFSKLATIGSKNVTDDKSAYNANKCIRRIASQLSHLANAYMNYIAKAIAMTLAAEKVLERHAKKAESVKESAMDSKIDYTIYESIEAYVLEQFSY